jgi:predicted ribosome quality control (RQC) complex YloA/Tae2 family protein
MKTRLTLADVMAEVRDLNAALIGHRLLNIYDVDEKTLLFRFKEPGKEPQTLLVESGIRVSMPNIRIESGPLFTTICVLSYMNDWSCSCIRHDTAASDHPIHLASA